MTAVRVFHCDDSDSFRLLVREVLDAHEDVEVVGEAADLAGAESALAEASPDVVLLDLLAQRREDELVGRIRAMCPQARVVLYSGMPRETGSSADARVAKSASFDELRRVIGEVARGA